MIPPLQLSLTGTTDEYFDYILVLTKKQRKNPNAVYEAPKLRFSPLYVIIEAFLKCTVVLQITEFDSMHVQTF